MQIKLNVVRWQNFLSTGNLFTEVRLDQDHTTFIYGENGSGKSTIIDAICFALFNKAFRKINKNQLVNSITNKNCLVEIELQVYKTHYKICRGIKPSVFQIYKNGKLLDQTAENKDYQEILEKNILKMNYKTFCQVVVLGSANFSPFMQLPAQSRRLLIEDLLDIQMFSSMNAFLKEKIAVNKSALQDIDYKIDSLKKSIKTHEQHKKTLSENTNALIAEKERDIEQRLLVLKENNTHLKSLQENVMKLNSELDDKKSLDKKIKDANIIKLQLQGKQKELKTTLQFYETSNDCPTCKQEITDSFKTSIVESVNKESSKLLKKQEQLNSILNDLDKKFTTVNKVLSTIDTLTQSITKYQNDNNVQLMFIDSAKKEIQKLKHPISISDSIEDEKVELEECETRKKDLIEERELNNIALLLLKDNGIKSNIIKQYIPLINKSINKYLDKMEFFCKFELSSEFEETIKSRHRDAFSYESFSEGEKMRIDLALLFTWREVAHLRNSSSINLLLLDEIMDSSLDSSGTEEFIKIIKQFTKNNNVFVISHKNEQMIDKFDKTIKFEKIKNFSKIV